MIVLKNEEQTKKLGYIISQKIQNGVIIALIGDLGSGKTTLSQSIIKNIIGSDDVSSPTFNIVNEYSSDKTTIYHFDLYRLEDEEELINIGYDDYLANKKSIILIEWADKFIDMLPTNHIKVEFEKLVDSRNLKITSNTKKYENIVEEIINSF